jgi:hypothetical protein
MVRSNESFGVLGVGEVKRFQVGGKLDGWILACGFLKAHVRAISQPMIVHPKAAFIHKIGQR